MFLLQRKGSRRRGGEGRRGFEDRKGAYKFLTLNEREGGGYILNRLSIVHCNVIENKVYFNPFLDQGGGPFDLKFHSELDDRVTSGLARFGNSKLVELSRFGNKNIFVGLNIPPARELSKCYQLFCSLM